MAEKLFQMPMFTMVIPIIYFIPRAAFAVGKSWRMDETYIKVKGEWIHLYRALARIGNTVDFLPTKRGNTFADYTFLLKAISHNGCPKVITIIDQSGASMEAIRTYKKRGFKKK